KKILLVGGGGHCKSVLDSLLELEQFSEIGILDKKEKMGEKILGVSVIGGDEDLPQLFTEGYKYAFVTVGGIGNSKLRIALFNKLSGIGFKIPNIIAPSAVVSSHVNLETGIFIGKNVVINAGSTIKKCAIINTGVIIEHDCFVGAFAHVASGSVLSGGVQIGENTHIGANSVIKQRLKIGSDSIIGMGSVVLKDMEDNIIAYGNPCKGV
ncbi:MAG: acetyltransferase, partial [Dysgonamonadaceae bacterium]|nr:acetyltransferase [Dysgonamonadaceae bacterium]